MSDPRSYPDRPFLAVSAAIFRDSKVLIVRRARAPGQGIYTLPGGGVELGETLAEAAIREVREETGLVVALAGLAGHRDVVLRDTAGRIARHFVVMCFAARWVSGEPTPSDELSEAAWRDPAEIAGLRTTEGLAAIVADASALLDLRS